MTGKRRGGKQRILIGVVAALLLAGCGTEGGSAGAEQPAGQESVAQAGTAEEAAEKAGTGQEEAEKTDTGREEAEKTGTEQKDAGQMQAALSIIMKPDRCRTFSRRLRKTG